MKKMKEETYNSLADFHCPRWKDLPEFDIYMDQVIFFISQQLAPLYFDNNEKIITNSMVNNYVKNSIVKPPIKKHYKRYHIAFLIVVSILKRVYSLNEISQMIKIQTDMKNSDLEAAYDTFSIYFENCLHEIVTQGHFSQNETAVHNSYQLLLMSVIQSVVLKIYVQAELETNSTIK